MQNNRMLIGEHEHGAALILSMLLLLILTLLASATMHSSIMQQRMVAGMAGGITSIEIVESGLRDAEKLLEGIDTLIVFDGSNGLYGPSDTAPVPFAHDWESSIGVRNATAVAGATPKYFIQHLGDLTRTDSVTGLAIEGYGYAQPLVTAKAFRIVVWTAGVNGRGQRLIESYYARELL